MFDYKRPDRRRGAADAVVAVAEHDPQEVLGANLASPSSAAPHAHRPALAEVPAARRE